MDYSSYIRVLLSVFIGLGLGQLAQGLHRLARFKGTVRWDALPLVWAFFTFLMVVQTWWAYFDLLQSPLWLNLFAFMLPMSVFVLLYMLSASALPDLSTSTDADVLDMAAFHMGQRRYFFGLWGVFMLLALLVSRLARGSFAFWEDGFRVLGFALALVLLGSGRRTVHVVVTVVAVIVFGAYITLFTLRIA